MKLSIVLLFFLCSHSFAATSIKSTEGESRITKLDKLSDSSLNWFFSWGQSSDLSKNQYCNTTDRNVENCNNSAANGFQIDKDTVCRVSLEKLEDKAKNGKFEPVAEVATVDCNSEDRSFQLNDFACALAKGSSNPSQSLNFNKGKTFLGKFSISCAKKLRI